MVYEGGVGVEKVQKTVYVVCEQRYRYQPLAVLADEKKKLIGCPLIHNDT